MRTKLQLQKCHIKQRGTEPGTHLEIALFIFSFLNVPQDDILTREEKHFSPPRREEQKPILYKDIDNK